MPNQTSVRRFDQKGLFEERVTRPRIIEGVETSTAAFVGPTLKGPVGGAPIAVTSFGAFSRIFGGLDNLDFGHGEVTNYLAHSVFNFFANGGERLYVSRTYAPYKTKGYAHSGIIGGDDDNHRNIVFRATTPGRFGNAIQVKLLLDQSRVVRNAAPGSLMYANRRFYIRRDNSWFDHRGEEYPGGAERKRLLTINLILRNSSGEETLYENLGFSPSHPRYIGEVLRANPLDVTGEPEEELALVIGSRVSAFRLYEILRKLHGITFRLNHGHDGAEPTAEAYQRSLSTLAGEEEIAMVAAPGSSSFKAWEMIQQRLLDYADAADHYCFAILDARPGVTPKTVMQDRESLNCASAALYYPWLKTAHPLAQRGKTDIPKEIVLPPSGFVCGLYSRNDISRGVHKPLSTDWVRGAVTFENEISPLQVERLNQLGVNTPLLMQNQELPVWDARTLSTEEQWRYVNVRRYYLYLKHSIERSTRWVVHEQNSEELWELLENQVSTFLHAEWQAGRLVGSSADEAFFVCCDHSTMAIDDVEQGRVVMMIGFAFSKPIDFNIFWVSHQAKVAAS